MIEHSEPLGAVAQDNAPMTLANPPAYRLFTPDQVGGASFCGGALAGGLLLWLNSRKLKDGRGLRNLFVSLLLTTATLALAFLLPEGFPGVVLGVVALLAMRAYAHKTQGAAIADHLSLGGPKGSLGLAIVTVLLSCGLIVGAVFGYVYATLPASFHLGKDEVIYRSGAQEGEARGLAESLKKAGFFDGQGVSVFLSKVDGTYHVGFVVKEGSWDSAETCDAFRSVAPELAQEAFHSAPVVRELVDDVGEVKKSL